MSQARSCLALMERHAAKMEAAGILPTTNAAAGKSGSSVLAAVGLTREDVLRITGKSGRAQRSLVQEILETARAKSPKEAMRRRMTMAVMPKYVPLLYRLKIWVRSGKPTSLARVLKEFQSFAPVHHTASRAMLYRVFGKKHPTIEELELAIEIVNEESKKQ